MISQYDSDGFCLVCGRENYSHYDNCTSYVTFKQETAALGMWPGNKESK